MRLTKYSRILLKYAVLAATGGFVYYGIENIWRGVGNSHPYMIIVGGACFVLLGAVNHYLPWEMCFTSQMMIAGLTITAVELASGLLLNVYLGLDLWNYSDVKYNFMGQICLSYAYLWQWLSAAGILLYDYAEWLLFRAEEDKPRYYIF